MFLPYLACCCSQYSFTSMFSLTILIRFSAVGIRCFVVSYISETCSLYWSKLSFKALYFFVCSLKLFLRVSTEVVAVLILSLRVVFSAFNSAILLTFLSVVFLASSIIVTASLSFVSNKPLSFSRRSFALESLAIVFLFVALDSLSIFLRTEISEFFESIVSFTLSSSSPKLSNDSLRVLFCSSKSLMYSSDSLIFSFADFLILSFLCIKTLFSSERVS